MEKSEYSEYLLKVAEMELVRTQIMSEIIERYNYRKLKELEKLILYGN